MRRGRRSAREEGETSRRLRRWVGAGGGGGGGSGRISEWIRRKRSVGTASEGKVVELRGIGNRNIVGVDKLSCNEFLELLL